MLPVFSPEGGRLATAANEVEYVEVGKRLLPKDVLAVRDPDGRVRNTITQIDQGVTALAWSGDATRLAFAAFRGIYIVGRDGTGQEQFAKVRGGDLAWSRQGRLAWTSELGGRIRVTNRARTRVRTLPVAGTSVAWSPDSRRLAYTTVDDGDDVVRTMGADGRRRRTVTRRCDGIYGTTLASVGSAIKWSPDGRQLLCTTFDRHLIAVNIRTGRTRVVAGGPNRFIIRSFDWQRAPRGR